MPFKFIQKALLGRRKLEEILNEAQTTFENYLTTNLPFNESYTSSAQTITAAGSLTLAHSLSSAPALVQCRLKCVTTELGYSVDDEVIINPAGNDPASTQSRGLSIVPDATNINIRYGSNASTITIIHKTTGVASSVTNANWNLIVKAWA